MNLNLNTLTTKSPKAMKVTVSSISIMFGCCSILTLTFLSQTDASLGSSEESGKDWSELEEEAAEADKDHERGIVDDYTAKKRKLMDKKGSGSQKKMKKK